MNTVVYYPHIYPTNRWIRLAVICWDEIYTLHPANAPEMPVEIQALNQQLGGVVKPIDIDQLLPKFHSEIEVLYENWIANVQSSLETSDDYEVEWFALFRGKFDPNLERKLIDKGIARYGVRETPVKAPKWMRSTIEAQRGEWVSSLPKPRGKTYTKYKLLMDLAESFAKKDKAVSEALFKEAEKLERRSMVTINRLDDYLFLPKNLAYDYLSLLAAKYAESSKRDVATPSEDSSSVLFHDASKVRGAVASALIEAYLPTDIEKIAPEKIAEFRNEFSASRLRFQTAIQSLVNEYNSVASEEQLGNLKKQIVEIAKDRITEAETIYKRGKVDMVVQTLGITLTAPALATSLASLLGVGIFAPAGIAATLALFTARVLIEKRKTHTEKVRNAWTYLLDMKKSIKVV